MAARWYCQGSARLRRGIFRLPPERSAVSKRPCSSAEAWERSTSRCGSSARRKSRCLRCSLLEPAKHRMTGVQPQTIDCGETGVAEPHQVMQERRWLIGGIRIAEVIPPFVIKALHQLRCAERGAL